MKDRAYAKVNLSLDILRRREDGYHELRSVMVPIDFYDVLEIKKAKEPSYSSNRRYIFWNENNTILKMISAVKRRYGIRDEFEINLEKSIPSQAGLAGGSADGAAALRILERMYHLHLSEEEIVELCREVGSDVLFTYYNSPALVEGTGEKLTFFDVEEDWYVLLVKPSAGVSTKESYQTLDLTKCAHPDVPGLKKALEEGRDPFPYMGNSLEQPAELLCPEVDRVKQLLKKEGAAHALMSGSGSTVFTLSKDRAEIMKLYENMKKYGLFTRIAKLL